MLKLTANEIRTIFKVDVTGQQSDDKEGYEGNELTPYTNSTLTEQNSPVPRTVDTSRTARLTRPTCDGKIQKRMSFRVKCGRYVVETDSAEEAYQILVRLEGGNPPRFSNETTTTIAEPAADPVVWNRGIFNAFRTLLQNQPQQRKLLITLYSAGKEGILKDDLVRRIELENPKQLGGPLSGLAKNAVKVGLREAAVCEIERLQVDGVRTSRYRMNQSLRTMFDDLLREEREKAEQQKLQSASNENQEDA